ncbi:hypothetical protein MNQ96_00395 [Sphingopyxis granuli]|uniref:hypothetical protein n=1 Tax=Sphingopyxis granuli TaxID=267128 RepID=UPI001F539BD9|nr:hypothetical protein [Sphingopyxis granuli]UNK79593.1 hypothetical protein MNQ96_00395 [Sphingopyxis granuli]
MTIAYRVAQVFGGLQMISYADTVRNIALGAFDDIGLAAPMIRMEAVANGLSCIGWAAILVLSALGRGKTAGRLAYGVAGMMWFDVLTTWRLDMPLPPYFLWWGSAVVVLQLLAGYTLERAGAKEQAA